MVLVGQHVCAPVIVNQSCCGQCHSNRSHSRYEWVVRAEGWGLHARAKLAASLGQTEEVALPRGWDGGRGGCGAIFVRSCMCVLRHQSVKTFVKSDCDYQQMSLNVGCIYPVTR